MTAHDDWLKRMFRGQRGTTPESQKEFDDKWGVGDSTPTYDGSGDQPYFPDSGAGPDDSPPPPPKKKKWWER